MHLPLTAALVATSAWKDAPADNTSLFSSSSMSSLELRQALAPPPPETSIVVITSVVTVTSIDITTSIVNNKPTNKPPTTSSSIPTTSETKPSSTSEQPTSTSAPTKSDSPSPTFTTQNSPPTDSTASLSSTSNLQTTSSPPAPKPTSPPIPNEGPRVGFIIGLTLSVIIGTILLGLLIYWLCALRRGVNVCDCFGLGGRRKREDRALPERHPAVLYPGYDKPLPRTPKRMYPTSGIGTALRREESWKGKGRMVEKEDREMGERKVQRKPDLGARRGLDTIPEF